VSIRIIAREKIGEKEAWAYLGTEEIFRVPWPLLSQEREKLRISNLAGIHFRASIRPKRSH